MSRRGSVVLALGGVLGLVCWAVVLGGAAQDNQHMFLRENQLGYLPGDVVKKIQASPIGQRGAYGTETLEPPIKILKAYRK